MRKHRLLRSPSGSILGKRPLRGGGAAERGRETRQQEESGSVKFSLMSVLLFSCRGPLARLPTAFLSLCRRAGLCHLILSFRTFGAHTVFLWIRICFSVVSKYALSFYVLCALYWGSGIVQPPGRSRKQAKEGPILDYYLKQSKFTWKYQLKINMKI